MKRTSLLILLLAVLLALALAACGKTDAAPAASTAPAAGTQAEAKATEAPTAEPTPEPTPTPRPFSIGTIEDDVYRNEFFGFELDYYPLSMEEYYTDPAYSVYEERNETTTAEEVDRVLLRGKTYCDLHLTGGGTAVDPTVSCSAELLIAKTPRTVQGELARMQNYYKAYKTYSDLTDPYPLTIGGQEWLVSDCVYTYESRNTRTNETSTGYCYMRLLVCGYNGYCATFGITARSYDADPTYEVVKPLLDEFSAAIQPITEKAEAAPPAKPFTMGVLTDDLYRSEYLGIEIPFGELGYDEDIQDWKYEYRDVSVIRDFEMTDEKAAEIIANGDTYYVDMGADAYFGGGRIETRIAVKFDRARTHYLQDPSDDRVLGRTTMTIGDREWEVIDQSYDHWSGRYLVYERDMVTYQDNVKARLEIIFQISNTINAPYDQVKPDLDELCAAFRPIEGSGPAPTSKPMATPVPENVPLAVESGVIFEQDGVTVTLEKASVDYTGDLHLFIKLKNTTEKEVYFGTSFKRKITVNGVSMPDYATYNSFDLNANGGTSFSLSLPLSDTSLAGIDPGEIREIQIPFALFKRSQQNGYYVYNSAKEYDAVTVKVGSN